MERKGEEYITYDVKYDNEMGVKETDGSIGQVYHFISEVLLYIHNVTNSGLCCDC